MASRYAVAAQAAARVRVPSRLGKEAFNDLIALPPSWRNECLLGMSDEDNREVMASAWKATGSYFGLWQDDPVGFYELVLLESLWSKQREILEALADPSIDTLVVPSCVGVGKTHISAGATCWFASVHPVGTAGVVTTATRMRQVTKQLWPHVRRMHKKSGLPGDCDMTQWKAPNADGVATEIAYGFTAPDNDESAMQGIHFPNLLLIVDEAGGIGRTIGQSTRNLLTGGAKMLLIGNPPTDDEGSWFESMAERGLDADKTRTRTIEIPAELSPGVTGEPIVCRACPSQVRSHYIGKHLNGQAWIDETIEEHGEDAPYVVAKVHAKFPRGGASRAIPGAYVDAAMEAVEVFGEWWDIGYRPVEPVSFDRAGKPYELQPPMGAVINLGVDVAADGGDELAIARQEGDVVRIRRFQSGPSLENAVTVAGIIKEEILAAEELRARLGTERKVHVKVDVIGVGWGVVGILEAWGSEGLHESVIVRADVRENPDRPDDKKAQWRPWRKRDELWLNGREMFKPDPTGRPRMRLDVDHKTAAQLRGPNYGTNASGYTVIESKKQMKERGIPSPDRAEAVLLALLQIRPKGRKTRITV